MSIIYKSPVTAQEWQRYFDLRWQILRAPWQQPRGSERDELEHTAYHVMAINNNGNAIGTGRLHQNNGNSAQIRYMAIAEEYRNQSIGHTILSLLEEKAKKWRCDVIMLNARSTAIQFYQDHNYIVTGEGHILFDVIAHTQMQKQIVL